MSKKPLFSICVAVYNLEKYIGQCLDSILNQSFVDYEILLIDNGSVDGSIAICEEYARKDDRIKYVKFPLPTLIGRPFAYACNNFSGKYFMCVDGDDFLVDNALQNIADAIKNRNASLIMGTFVCDIEEGMSNFKDADFDSAKINGVPYKEALRYLRELPNFHTFQWRFIVERDLLKKCNEDSGLRMTDDALKNRYNDSFTVVRYLVNADSIWYMEEPFYVYRQRKTSLSAPLYRGTQALEFLKNYLRLIDRNVELLKQGCSYKVEYIYSITKARFEMFRELLLEMNDSEYSKAVEILEEYKFLIPIAKNMSGTYARFCEYIEDSEDVLTAMRKYRETETQRLLNSIEECEGKKVYVFPTGMCGESTCSFLKNNGVVVEAFLDNDMLKNGEYFENVVCKLPSMLMDEENIEDVCVFIATAYEKNVETMKSQLLKYGVLEENIKIR